MSAAAGRRRRYRSPGPSPALRAAAAGAPRLDDDAWQDIKPLIPAREAPGTGRAARGRPPADDRQVLEALLLILTARVGFGQLDRLGTVSARTCWNRLRAWRAAGAWPAIADRLAMLPGCAHLDFTILSRPQPTHLAKAPHHPGGTP